jgi:3-phenylpropionate/trans-cinnamate dioxygenase ferredoxin subunit
MADVEIVVTENGPYRVKGSIRLVDPEGNEIEVIGRDAFLCRCGGSTTKPFCDGTHSKIGFQGAIMAVKEAES